MQHKRIEFLHTIKTGLVFLGKDFGRLAVQLKQNRHAKSLGLHPHLHCVVPAGDFDPGYSHWIRPRYPFFLPAKVLSRVFCGKFLDFFQRVSRQPLPRLDSTLLRSLLLEDWVVYAKPAFGEPDRVLRYLGRYTHRVAISNQRLLSFDHRRGRDQQLITRTSFLQDQLQINKCLTVVYSRIVGDTEVTKSFPAVRSGVARFTGSLACTPQ